MLCAATCTPIDRAELSTLTRCGATCGTGVGVVPGGGIGNIIGAVIGGIILGVLEQVGPNLFLTGYGVPSPNQLQDVIAFTVLVLVLIFRPSGLLGRKEDV